MRLALVDPYDPLAEAIWRTLEARAAPRYFLTWGWIESWLACLPRGEAPPLAVVYDGGLAIAAAFVGRHLRVRGHVVPVRTRFLNTTGIAARDDLCLEHNQILCAPGAPLTLARWISLLPHDWDELALGALDVDRFPGDQLGAPLPDAQVIVDREVPAPFVDLEAVREAGDYTKLLGADTRAQIRRARRGFGEVRVEVAADVADALAFYGELTALHGASWRARGEPGAFADPWVDAFHRRLIARRFAHGEIQLVRVRAADTTIGCLYELVSGGRVLFYQSGLARFDDPHLRAGYVCHAEAVRLAAAAGHAVYDFLAGDRAYKQRLATGAARLVWARVQRPRWRFAVETQLRRAISSR